MHFLNALLQIKNAIRNIRKSYPSINYNKHLSKTCFCRNILQLQNKKEYKLINGSRKGIIHAFKFWKLP